MSILKFKGKAPELIKIAIASGSVNTFFDSTNDYEPIAFDSTLLDYVYGDLIFTDVDNQKNMIWVNTTPTGDCLDTVNTFIKNPT